MLLAELSSACIPLTYEELTLVDEQRIDRALDRQGGEVNSNSIVRKRTVLGTGTPFIVMLEFEPHRSDGDVNTYFYVKCLNHNKKGEWICNAPEEKTSISFLSPRDDVEVVGGLNS